ncbi:MAG: hypothetical protein M4579_000038 [Chaenotheca gracillima]|nr:MAG: hypothetical protein M4579_000038 [Chaenotheca gracillima]
MDHPTQEEERGPGARDQDNNTPTLPAAGAMEGVRSTFNFKQDSDFSNGSPSASTHSHSDDGAPQPFIIPLLHRDSIATNVPVPSGAGLRVQTDLSPQHALTGASNAVNSMEGCKTPTAHPKRNSSVKATLSASSSVVGSLSPASAISSPGLGPMADITPLPSPLTATDPSGIWRRVSTRGESRTTSLFAAEGTLPASSSPPKRKTYAGLKPASHDTHEKVRQAQESNQGSHGRNRSISEYVPDAMQVPRQRNVTVAGVGALDTPTTSTASETKLKREEYLAVQRGVSEAAKPPTPPSSNIGADSSDSESSHHIPAEKMQHRTGYEYFTAKRVKDNTQRNWRSVRPLGQGTFSKVILATSQEEQTGPNSKESVGNPDLRTLVAVKVVEHGPAGGASEERIETSLRRELDILKSIHHPSLVHLKAFSQSSNRALLVLTYCPGGDMFEVASQKLDLLVPPLIRRIFAELVSATRYLHNKLIVHRDIKLENVLLHIPRERLPEIKDWQTYPYAVVMLTDLGLSRRIDLADPKLHTRCGSEDYASPELLMGQAYDGRQTDAWALGVLLYALMEGRLPFDPLPGVSDQQKARNRTVHRIARCDWSWFRYADDEGEAGDFGELAGAQIIVDGLLKRATRRFSLDRVAEEEWVRGGIQVEGGVQLGEEI